MLISSHAIPQSKLGYLPYLGKSNQKMTLYSTKLKTESPRAYSSTFMVGMSGVFNALSSIESYKPFLKAYCS